ncbi:glycosyltransferase [Paracoccus sp. TOH]|uniref:glycosyltransferase n=1 Tax=Paracoccus sp. TOH TaxID=1263728 RepID=UPI0025B0AA29|nr:glycosyltransferase [Paracoccus sp. TOH]WJS85327.1 glycosyltransferase [Paracoccus sp. TOH]
MSSLGLHLFELLMLSQKSVDLEGLPFPKAREHWLTASKQMDKKSAIDLACKLIPLYPERPFFPAHALDLAKATGDELRVARLVLEVAEGEVSVALQPVFTATDMLLASSQASPAECAKAIYLRDRLMEVSPQRHFFRAQLARRENKVDTALNEVSTHLDLFPSDAPALILRATLAMQTGRWGRYCNEISALASIQSNPRSTELLNLFQTFQAAQGLSSTTPSDLVLNQERLETPGAVYEYAMDRAPEPDTAVRQGVVLLTGSLAGGGAERIVATMCRQFKEMEPAENLQLWLFSKTNGPAGNALFYLPLTGLREEELHIIEPVRQSSEPFCWLPPFYAQRAQAIYDDLMRLRPRVLYITLDEAIIAGGIAAVMAGVPRIVLHCHNMSPPNLHGDTRLSFGWDRAFRMLLARPNVQYVNVAQVAVDDYLDWCATPPNACRAAVIHNGVDFSPIDEGLRDDQPSRIRCELGIPPNSPVIGAAIRFTDVKQPLVWLEAARLIRNARQDAHFIMYGDGVLLESCKIRAAHLGLEDCVHFPGRVSDLAQRLAVFDIMMLSSRSEGFPNVLIEAQAAGVVPVSFDVGGCRETMEPGRSGLVVPECTAKALAAEVITLLNKPQRLKRMSRRAMKFVRKTFSIDQMMEQLHDLVYGTRLSDFGERAPSAKLARKGKRPAKSHANASLK